MACLNSVGKTPVDKDKLTILVIVVAKTGRHFFRRAVGNGSRSHCLSGDCFTMLDISLTVACRKESNTEGVVTGPGMWGDIRVDEILARRLVILSAKN